MRRLSDQGPYGILERDKKSRAYSQKLHTCKTYTYLNTIQKTVSTYIDVFH